ncbi:hypothetical protein BV25DRAFT_759554 [Artomyces pyxidatus]|uniref:Uncharacterized protein n=1 Tax=Artomyces pyxidatus TaxID=48021 RepID=A0ACB8SYF1_9AGAM|nr:hypothetical protein BV25DRAFT_759554 [Artomyces pyxidatus]
MSRSELSVETDQVNSSAQMHGTPISCLPFEIVSKIFSILRGLAGNAAPKRGRPHSCLVVTQVCTHWRRIAFSTKDMWTDIPLESHLWTQLALEQSKPSPISVRWVHDEHSADGGKPDSEALFLALCELPRIRDLWLEGDPHDTSDRKTFMNVANHVLAARTAPLLETLFLGYSLYNRPYLYLGEIFEDKIPPKLRQLNLYRCQLPPSSVLFAPTITNLGVNNCDIWSTYDELKSTLALMPHLRTLDVYPFTLPPSAHGGPTGRPVDLPNIRILNLQGDTLQIIQAMHSISIPHDGDELILGYLSSPTIDDGGVYIIFTTLDEHFNAAIAAGASYETVHITQAAGVPNFVVLSGRNPVCASGARYLPWSLEVSLCWPTEDTSMGVACALLGGLRVMGGVRTLWVDHAMFGDAAWWKALHTAMPKLQKIVTRERGAHGLASAFKGDGQSFPDLRELCVQNVQLGGLGGSPTLCTALLTEMKRRRERGSPCLLSISDCEVSREVVVELREILGRDAVDWDGDAVDNSEDTF